MRAATSSAAASTTSRYLTDLVKRSPLIANVDRQRIFSWAIRMAAS